MVYRGVVLYDEKLSAHFRDNLTPDQNFLILLTLGLVVVLPDYRISSSSLELCRFTYRLSMLLQNEKFES